MQETVLRTPEGKKVVVNEKKDECLFKAPRNPPNTGTKYTSGDDFFVHKARSGTIYFYVSEWSMWQGAEQPTYLVSPEKMRELLIAQASETGWGALDEDEIKKAEKHFPGIFEEDA